MITANQALKLYQDSSVEVDEFLKLTVEPEVIKAANSGKKQTIVHLGAVAYYDYVQQKLTPLHLAVIERLKALGYIAEAKKYGESYVPRGLADDQGNGPMHTNYGIHIVW